MVLVAGTLTALFLHSGERHQRSHLSAVAEAGGASTSAEPARAVAFVDVSVRSMTGEPPRRHQVVVVRDGFIERIGPVGVIEPPEDAQIVEGTGSEFVVPGLVDAHVHLPEAREDFLPLFLANGVTTVFNLEGDARHLELRARSREPGFRGPTVFTSGPFLDQSNVLTPDDARRSVADQSNAGYDFVKLHGRFSAPTYAALIDAADSAGITVVGHAPRNLPFSTLLEQGQRGLAHAEELIYTELRSLDVDRAHDVGRSLADANVWVTPAMSTFENISEQWGSREGLDRRLARPEARYLPASLRRSWDDTEVYVRRPASERDRIEAMNAFHGPMIRALNAEGVDLLAGTDTPLPGLVPGFSLHDELDALRSAGLSNDDVLAAATAEAGRFIRENVDPTADFGTVRVGARADLILVEGDPGMDIGLLRHPLGVMARGVWYGQSDLDRLLALTARPAVADPQR